MTPDNYFSSDDLGHEAAKPCRGVIIVDTGILMGLSGAVQIGDQRSERSHNAASRNNRSHYFDILKFLADSGYRIIIPEIVTYEASSVLRGGYNLDKLFRHHKFHNTPGLQDFLISAGKNQIPNIETPFLTTNGPQDILEFMKKFQDILDRDVPSGAISDAIARHRSAKPIHAGEVVVRHIAETTRKDPPVFVLSDDWRFIEKLPANSGYNVVTLQGLLCSLRNSGLLAALPEIAPRKSLEEFCRKCAEASVKNFPTYRMLKRTIDCSLSKLDVRDADNPDMQDRPLLTSFLEIAEERKLPHESRAEMQFPHSIMPSEYYAQRIENNTPPPLSRGRRR